MNRYSEADKGRFDVYLLRDGIAIAYTDYDIVRIYTENYRGEDYDAVGEFAESYDLPIIWE